MGIMQQAGLNSDNNLPSIWRVDVKSLPLYWPTTLDLLKRFPHGPIEFTNQEDLYILLEDESLDLWLGVEDGEIKLAGLTTFYGSKNKYLEILWVGGDSFDFFKDNALDKLERWAALHGANRIVAGGRIGLQRLLRAQGFGFHRVELSKPNKYLVTDTGKVDWRN